MHRPQLPGDNRLAKIVDLVDLWPNEAVTSKLDHVCERLWAHKLLVDQQQFSVRLGYAPAVEGCLLLWDGRD